MKRIRVPFRSVKDPHDYSFVDSPVSVVVGATPAPTRRVNINSFVDCVIIDWVNYQPTCTGGTFV